MSRKLARFFLDIEEMNTHYISVPRKKLLRKAMIINAYLFVLYFISFNIYIILLLLSVYVLLLVLFYMFTKICGKYRYKKAVLFPLFIIFNVFSCTAAVYLRSLFMKIVGF